MDKTTLYTTIQSLINNTQITTTELYGIVILAEAEMFPSLKPGYRSQLVTSLTSSSGELDIPANCKHIRALYVEEASGVWKLLKQYSLVDLLANKENGANTPTHYALGVSGTETALSSKKIFLNSNSDGETFKLYYFEGAPATILGGDETNWISEDYPMLYVTSCMKWANIFLLNEEQAALWDAKYQAYKNVVETEEQARLFSGSPVVVNPRSQESS